MRTRLREVIRGAVAATVVFGAVPAVLVAFVGVQRHQHACYLEPDIGLYARSNRAETEYLLRNVRRQAGNAHRYRAQACVPELEGNARGEKQGHDQPHQLAPTRRAKSEPAVPRIGVGWSRPARKQR